MPSTITQEELLSMAPESITSPPLFTPYISEKTYSVIPDNHPYAEILRRHQLWLDGESSGERANFGNMALSYVDFSGFNLSGANFANAHLSFANFSNTDLTNAVFRETLLDDTNFTDGVLVFADLTGASLRRGNLTNTNLSNARLNNADLSQSDLNGASLISAHLSNANLFLTDLHWANLSFADCTYAVFRGAVLRECNAIETKFHYADLSSADLTHSSFNKSDFLNAVLVSTLAKKTHFNEANFTGAACTNADFSQAEFNAATLFQTKLSESTLIETDFSFADLREANLDDAVLGWTVFHKVDLSNTNLEHADFSGLNVSESNLRHANLKFAAVIGTNFAESDLTNADLSSANASRANFRDAKLNDTVMTDTNLEKAIITGTCLEQENRFSVRGVLSSIHIHEAKPGADSFNNCAEIVLNMKFTNSDPLSDPDFQYKVQIPARETKAFARLKSLEKVLSRLNSIENREPVIVLEVSTDNFLFESSQHIHHFDSNPPVFKGNILFGTDFTIIPPELITEKQDKYQVQGEFSATLDRPALDNEFITESLDDLSLITSIDVQNEFDSDASLVAAAYDAVGLTFVNQFLTRDRLSQFNSDVYYNLSIWLDTIKEQFNIEPEDAKILLLGPDKAGAKLIEHFYELRYREEFTQNQTLAKTLTKNLSAYIDSAAETVGYNRRPHPSGNRLKDEWDPVYYRFFSPSPEAGVYLVSPQLLDVLKENPDKAEQLIKQYTTKRHTVTPASELFDSHTVRLNAEQYPAMATQVIPRCTSPQQLAFLFIEYVKSSSKTSKDIPSSTYIDLLSCIYDIDPKNARGENFRSTFEKVLPSIRFQAHKNSDSSLEPEPYTASLKIIVDPSRKKIHLYACNETAIEGKTQLIHDARQETPEEANRFQVVSRDQNPAFILDLSPKAQAELADLSKKELRFTLNHFTDVKMGSYDLTLPQSDPNRGRPLPIFKVESVRDPQQPRQLNALTITPPASPDPSTEENPANPLPSKPKPSFSLSMSS